MSLCDYLTDCNSYSVSELISGSSDYDCVLSECREYLSENSDGLNALQKAELIHDYLHEKVINGYESNQSSAEDLMSTGYGNCVASTVLNYSLINDLLSGEDLKVKVITPKGHVALLLEYKGSDYFVENTNPYGFNVEFSDSYNIHEEGESALMAILYNNKALNAGSLEEAMGYYETALSYNEDLEEVHLNLASTYSLLGLNGLASTHYNNAGRINTSKIKFEKKDSLLSVPFKTVKIKGENFIFYDNLFEIPLIPARLVTLTRDRDFYYKQKEFLKFKYFKTE